MTHLQADVERPFLTPAAHALYLQVLRRELTNLPPSPEREQLLGVDLLAPDPDPDREGHFIALDVAGALRRWQSGLHTMASTLLLEAQNVEAQLQPLAAAWAQAQAGQISTPGVELVRGYKEIDRRLGPIIASCRVEALTAHPTGPRSAKVLARSYERDLPLLQRGAKMRTIYLPSVRGDAATGRWAQTMTEEGVQIRTSSDFCRVIIIDYHTVITSVLRRGDQITEPEPNDAAMIVTNPVLVAHWLAGFERDWDRAEPWDGKLTEPAPKLPLTPTEVSILRCLAQGMDQDDAAEANHVSRRYVTGKLAELRTATGSTSHGQLMFWWGEHHGDYKKEKKRKR